MYLELKTEEVVDWFNKHHEELRMKHKHFIPENISKYFDDESSRWLADIQRNGKIVALLNFTTDIAIEKETGKRIDMYYLRQLDSFLKGLGMKMLRKFLKKHDKACVFWSAKWGPDMKSIPKLVELYKTTNKDVVMLESEKGPVVFFSNNKNPDLNESILKEYFSNDINQRHKLHYGYLLGERIQDG